MCGICGVIGEHHEDVLELGMPLTTSLWNRGHDGVGITVINNETGAMRRHVNVRQSRRSPLDEEFKNTVEANAKDVRATMFLGQTKFTTIALSPDKRFVYDNTQPINLQYSRDGNVVIPEVTGIQNGEVVSDSLIPHITTTSLSEAVVDTRYLTEAYHSKLIEFGDDLWQAAEWLLDTAVGAFTFGFSDGRNCMFIIDKGGIRKGVIGRKKGKYGDIYVVASEDGNFPELGISRGLESYDDGFLEGGEAILFQPGKKPIRRRLRNEPSTPCWFESHYFERHFSNIPTGRISNSEFRALEVEELAEFYRDDIKDHDFVFHVPDSGKSFANRLSELIGLPYRPDVCRKPELTERTRNYLLARLEKLHEFIFNRPDIEGKDGVAVDDSVVAGDSAAHFFVKWKKYGGGRLTLLSAAPPMLRRCPYGVGFPEKEGLIHLVGFALLMTAVLVISYNDINRLIQGGSLLGG